MAPQASSCLAQALKSAQDAQWETALAQGLEAVHLEPGSWSLIEPLVVSFCATGRLSDAEHLIQASLQRASVASPDLANALGCLALERGAWFEAVDCFGKALAAAPDCAAYQGNHAVALRAVGQSDSAASRLERARAASPADVRLERLALLAGSADATGWLPFTAGLAMGHCFPLAAQSPEPMREGWPVSLTRDLRGSWEFAPGAGASPLRPGLPVLMCVWNEAGLFLRQGTLGALEGGRMLLQGPEGCRVQRRRYFRMLTPREFLQVDGTGKAEADLHDVSACGLSYYDGTPPSPGKVLTVNLRFPRVMIPVEGAVRHVRDSRRRESLVALEFRCEARQSDRIATLLMEQQRRRKVQSRQSA